MNNECKEYLKAHVNEFKNFFKENVKWYEFKHKLWFAANFGE